MNVTSFNHGRIRGRGRGKNQFRYPTNQYNHNNKNISHHQKWIKKDEAQGKEKGGIKKRPIENICHRCSMQGHWSRTCRMSKHLVDLYQESLKSKGKNIETNFITDDFNNFSNSLEDITHLDVDDFLVYPEN